MEDQKETERVVRRWYDRLAERDPKLHEALRATIEEPESQIGPAVMTEGPALAGGAPTHEGLPMPDIDAVRLETIVQLGRPALFVVKDEIRPETPLTDLVSKLMIDRVMDAGARLNPCMPLIGRIDTDNHPAGFPFVGTGWLIQPGLLCTNRHVGELIGRQDGAKFTFTRGRFDQPLSVRFNRGHEYNQPDDPATSYPITGIAWIEPADGPDVALLRVDMPQDGTRPQFLALADDDGTRDDFIAAIGYPARAYEDAIPDQQWMDQIYGGVYDLKRAAPGQLDDPANGSTTYDCTTLGGASGSPVFDLATGKVVALHYAGLYKVENYGVPASKLRGYAAKIPVIRMPETPNSGARAPTPPPSPPPPPSSVAAVAAASPAPGIAPGSISFTVPLTITVSLGQPGGAISAMSLDDAIAQLAAERRDGVLAVKPGFNGRTDTIVVAADPGSYEALRQAMPASYAGHPVEVRYATIDEQLGLTASKVEALGTIVYDDTRRQGAEFSFDQVTDEEMTVIAHVGPEQSFPVLQSFIQGAKKTFVSSMYQFFASHIAEAVEGVLKTGDVAMRIVLDPATRDPRTNVLKPGEFDRSDTFRLWKDKYRFDNIYVRKGTGGLIDSAYHIKVTVRDGEWVWLSSGNWTKSSQPFPDPVTHAARGNREWHIVIQSRKLSTMFAAHIAADFDQCKELGATNEAPDPGEQLVDVPEEVVVEAPVRLLDPLRVTGRKVKVQPILTPDRRGRVYTDAVLGLIRSATDQLVFQNQYIKIRKGMTGNLSDLVDALIERSRSIRDVRVILRSGDVDDDLAELRRRGLDVAKCVRIIANTHTKGLVADAQRVLIGSQNWSEQAVATNRDASLLFDDAEIASYFQQAFEIDWERARGPATARPERPALLARGDAPPPGYRRMSLSEYRND